MITWNNKRSNRSRDEIIKDNVCLNCGSIFNQKRKLILIGNGITNHCFCVNCKNDDLINKLRYEYMYGKVGSNE